MIISLSAEMRIIDVSITLDERTPTYPGDRPYERAPVMSRAQGDVAEVSRLTLGSHAGTHVDVPHHFIEGGADLSAVGLEAFVGPCRVVEATGRRRLEAADVAAAAPAPGERILFKTDNSALWGREGFIRDYAYVTGGAAEALAASGVVLVGWDYLSVEEFGGEGTPAHEALLGAGVMILEGLNLARVEAGEYFLAALPLAIAGGDGSPVRAVLLEDWYAEEAP